MRPRRAQLALRATRVPSASTTPESSSSTTSAWARTASPRIDGQPGDDASGIDLRVLRQVQAAAAVGRDPWLERQAPVGLEPLAPERVVPGAVEREHERPAPRIARIDTGLVHQLTGERRPELGRPVRERGEPGCLGIGGQHSRSRERGAAAGTLALEDAHAQATLHRTPRRRQADDPAADDRRIEPLHEEGR